MNETPGVFRIDREPRAPSEHPGLDRELVEEVLLDAQHRPRIRIWRSSRSLVAARREQMHPAFASASARSAERGWPVVVRDSGGQVVPHDEGVLNVTFVRVSAGAVSLPESYAALLDPIVSLAGEYGCDARCGRVANSVCEGKYDLSIGGRKFCGSAQRCVLRPCPTGATHVTVGHASIFCALDLDASVTAVSDFYRELTEPRAFHRDSHIDLRLAAGVTLDMHELALSLADQYRERWHAGRDVWCARPVLFS